MPDDYGDDGDESRMDGKPEMASSDKPEKEEEGQQSALIPKSLFAGKTFNPGDEIVLRIVHLYEDEAEVEYSKADKSEEKKPMTQMSESEGALDKMAMAKEY